MSYTDWKIPYSTTIVPQELLDAGYSALLAAVLNVRGLSDPEQARAFLECDDALLGDPLMTTVLRDCRKKISWETIGGISLWEPG